jgi:hypothetical protein
MKFNIANAQRIGFGQNDPTVVCRAETAAIIDGVSSDIHPSPIRVGQRGLTSVQLLALLTTNRPDAQTILRPTYSSAITYQKSLTYPKVMAPTDFVTDGSGLATFTYPNPLLNPNAVDQVPHLSITAINSTVPVAYTITSLTRTGATVKAYNANTGAVLASQTLRISAEDRGGGGAATLL